MSALLALLASSFLAATVFPAQSEAVLAGMLMADDYPATLLVAIASVGNTLGAVLNWALGRGIETWRHKKWFPVSDKALERAQERYAIYGRWSLLLSWMPVIGDPLTFAAGIMREKFWPFFLIAGFAKTARYVFIAGII